MNKISLLLVEDDDDHARLVLRILDQYPMIHHVVRARDGVQAIDHLRNPDPDPKIRTNFVLMDLKLPKMGGLQVLEEIRNNPVLTNLPVVILTTSAAEIDRAKAYEHHANSYLIKPIEFSEFRALVDQFATYWAAWNQNPPAEAPTEAGTPPR